MRIRTRTVRALLVSAGVLSVWAATAHAADLPGVGVGVSASAGAVGVSAQAGPVSASAQVSTPPIETPAAVPDPPAAPALPAAPQVAAPAVQASVSTPVAQAGASVAVPPTGVGAPRAPAPAKPTQPAPRQPPARAPKAPGSPRAPAAQESASDSGEASPAPAQDRPQPALVPPAESATPTATGSIDGNRYTPETTARAALRRVAETAPDARPAIPAAELRALEALRAGKHRAAAFRARRSTASSLPAGTAAPSATTTRQTWIAALQRTRQAIPAHAPARIPPVPPSRDGSQTFVLVPSGGGGYLFDLLAALLAAFVLTAPQLGALLRSPRRRSPSAVLRLLLARPG